jgi:hypothetical protein
MSQQCPSASGRLPGNGTRPGGHCDPKTERQCKRETLEECVRILAGGASGIYYECKRAVPLRFQRQLHTPNRRYTFTGDLRGIVDRMPALQQTHYGSQYLNGPSTGTVCPSLCADGGQVVGARQVIDTSAQSLP